MKVRLISRMSGYGIVGDVCVYKGRERWAGENVCKRMRGAWGKNKK